jgi:cell division inhibitor SepF
MLKPFNKMMGAIGLIDEEDDEEKEEEIEDDDYFEPEVINSKRNKVVSIKGGAQTKILLKKPSEFQDIMEIVDSVKLRRIVVMNISEIDQKNAQRMIDYVVGAIYALNGSFEEVAKSIYVIAPESVEISNELKQELNRNTFFSFSDR